MGDAVPARDRLFDDEGERQRGDGQVHARQAQGRHTDDEACGGGEKRAGRERERERHAGQFEHCRGICADGHKGGMAQRQLSGVTSEYGQAQAGNAEDANEDGLRDEVGWRHQRQA